MKEKQKYKKMGRYKIESVIGRGAMGVVYKAYDPIIERYVAIKAIEISKSLPADEYEDYMSRFYREAQAAGRLSHPNIVTIYDVSTDKNTGFSFIVMEFIEGNDLNYFLNKGMMFSLHDILNIMEQAADALEYAHQNGIVHRDIKCSNILLQKEMKVKIVDFGIAKTVTSNITREGQFLGTPNYMSPEQIQGLPVDHRTDIYSLGVVMYRLLTGERPFQADSFAGISYKILNEQPAPPKYLNPLLPIMCDNIIAKMLAKDPNKRYQSAKSFRDDIWLLQSQDYASSKAIGAKIEYKIYLKNIINQFKKYKYTLLALTILIVVLLIINLSIKQNSSSKISRSTNQSESIKTPVNTNNIPNNIISNEDAEFNKYKQFGINYYNNNNYLKASTSIAKALLIKKDDKLVNYFLKSVNEALKMNVNCSNQEKNTISINLKAIDISAGYIIIQQDENICSIMKLSSNEFNTKLLIKNIKSILTIYYFNVIQNDIFSASYSLEPSSSLIYNLILSFDKGENKLILTFNKD